MSVVDTPPDGNEETLSQREYLALDYMVALWHWMMIKTDGYRKQLTPQDKLERYQLFRR